MSSIAGIYILQQIDTKIERNKQRMREIGRVLDKNQIVQQTAMKVDVATDSVLAATKEQTSIQGEIDIVTSKHKSGENRLYSGAVTSPKELKDLQDQGEALTRRIAELEDSKLEAMIAEEDCKTELDDAVAQHNIAMSERTTLENELGFENETLANDIENLNSEREVALNVIPAELLGKYDTARLKYRGVAVALVNDGICSCCGLGVSTGHIQDARSGNSIVTCDNCNRFLYVK